MAEAIWIIIFIPVVMWIISSLIRGGAEEDKPQAGGRKQPTTNDLDRFLEEVNRRRREAAQRENRPAETVAPPRRGPTPTVTARPQPPRPAQQTTPPRPTATPSRPTPARPTPARAVEMPAKPTPVRRTPDVPIQTVIAVDEVVLPMAQVVLPARPVVPKLGDLKGISGKRKASPAAELLSNMLRSPEGLRTAFLIREIFDGPRCKRRQ